MCRSRLVGDRNVGESKEWQLVVQWKRGHDVQAFEGFASHVGRKMREATEAEAEVVQLSDLVGPSGSGCSYVDDHVQVTCLCGC